MKKAPQISIEGMDRTMHLPHLQFSPTDNMSSKFAGQFAITPSNFFMGATVLGSSSNKTPTGLISGKHLLEMKGKMIHTPIAQSPMGKFNLQGNMSKIKTPGILVPKASPSSLSGNFKMEDVGMY